MVTISAAKCKKLERIFLADAIVRSVYILFEPNAYYCFLAGVHLKNTKHYPPQYVGHFTF